MIIYSLEVAINELDLSTLNNPLQTWEMACVKACQALLSNCRTGRKTDATGSSRKAQPRHNTSRNPRGSPG